MDRRTMLGMMGTGTVGLALGGSEAFGAEKSMMDKAHEECLKACSDCAKACDMAFHHCTKEVAEGKREHAKPLHYLIDCAAFCGLSACMIARHSPLMVESCMACGEACKKTAAVVVKFDSEEMKAASEKLLACVESCKAMVEAMKGHEHSAGHSK